MYRFSAYIPKKHEVPGFLGKYFGAEWWAKKPRVASYVRIFLYAIMGQKTHPKNGNCMFLGYIITILVALSFSACVQSPSVPAGFEDLAVALPEAQLSVRYYGEENFVGKPIDGYQKPTLWLSKEATAALRKVCQRIQKDGYKLVIYDAYRPQSGPDHFTRWSEDFQDANRKADYYPYVTKEQIFKEGYVANPSSHSRGSTVDLTLIEAGKKLHPIKRSKRTLPSGKVILFLDDGTVDMGSSFDLFDTVSHPNSNDIPAAARTHRDYLKKVMEEAGFMQILPEWWHFTLRDEPYPNQYFTYPIQ